MKKFVSDLKQDPGQTLIRIRIQAKAKRIRIQQKGLSTTIILKIDEKRLKSHVLWVYTTYQSLFYK